MFLVNASVIFDSNVKSNKNGSRVLDTVPHKIARKFSMSWHQPNLVNITRHILLDRLGLGRSSIIHSTK